jgi:hypothetical protein
LRAETGADVIAEYSPGHAQAVDLIDALYPDATLIHLVGDGRRIATRITRGAIWTTPVEAARTWCADQRAVVACTHAGMNNARVEDLAADPKGAIAELGALLGVDPGAALDEAARELEPLAARDAGPPSGRVAALVEALGGDLLDRFDYPATGRPTALAVAKAELALSAAREATQGLGARMRFAVRTYQHHRRRLKHELAQPEREAGMPQLRPNIKARNA